MKGFIMVERKILKEIIKDTEMVALVGRIEFYSSYHYGTWDFYHGIADTIPGQCNIAVSAFARLHNCSRTKIRSMLKELESLDYIVFGTVKIKNRLKDRLKDRLKEQVQNVFFIKRFLDVSENKNDEKNTSKNTVKNQVKGQLSKKVINKESKYLKKAVEQDARAGAYDPPELKLVGQPDIRPKQTRQKKARITAYASDHPFAEAFNFLNRWEPFAKIFDTNKETERFEQWVKDGLTPKEIADVCKTIWRNAPEVKKNGERAKLNNYLGPALKRKKSTGSIDGNFGNTQKTVAQTAKEELSRRCDELGWD